MDVIIVPKDTKLYMAVMFSQIMPSDIMSSNPDDSAQTTTTIHIMFHQIISSDIMSSNPDDSAQRVTHASYHLTKSRRLTPSHPIIIILLRRLSFLTKRSVACKAPASGHGLISPVCHIPSTPNIHSPNIVNCPVTLCHPIQMILLRQVPLIYIHQIL